MNKKLSKYLDTIGFILIDKTYSSDMRYGDCKRLNYTYVNYHLRIEEFDNKEEYYFCDANKTHGNFSNEYRGDNADSLLKSLRNEFKKDIRIDIINDLL